MRLRSDADALLVKEAEKLGLSINEAVELAVREWAGRQVQPNFKNR